MTYDKYDTTRFRETYYRVCGMEKMRVEPGKDWTVYLGDCLEILPTLEAGSFKSVMTILTRTYIHGIILISTYKGEVPCMNKSMIYK